VRERNGGDVKNEGKETMRQRRLERKVAGEEEGVGRAQKSECGCGVRMPYDFWPAGGALYQAWGNPRGGELLEHNSHLPFSEVSLPDA